MKKRILVVGMAAILLLLPGCSKDGQQPQADLTPTGVVQAGTVPPSVTGGEPGQDGRDTPDDPGNADSPGIQEGLEEGGLEEKEYAAERQYVKYIGRVVMENGICWLSQSASGIEFTFTGTSASITVASDSTLTSGLSSRARFAIYVDGERVVDEQVGKLQNVYEVFSSDTPKETTIKVLKLSEAANSTMGIKNIKVTCEGDIVPTEGKGLKIEFVGDSITCGYGVDDEDCNHHFSTATEDATKAYAYKTAELLDADYSLVSYSGHGIISGYTSNGTPVTEQLVPPVYGQVAKSYGSFGNFNVGDVAWDFGYFPADFVVINLGTNDYSYIGTDKEKEASYVAAYVEFLKTVRENNPDAHIICALGIMGDQLYQAVEEAVGRYIEETGDINVSAFHLAPQNGSTGYAADWHPTEATHAIAAGALAGEIRRLAGE